MAITSLAAQRGRCTLEYTFRQASGGPTSEVFADFSRLIVLQFHQAEAGGGGGAGAAAQQVGRHASPPQPRLELVARCIIADLPCSQQVRQVLAHSRLFRNAG